MSLRHTFPAGQTSAAKIKALLACLEDKKGKAAADEWLAAIRLARDDLEDETRLLPLGALRSALGAFLERVPDGLAQVAPHLVAQSNLGIWVRVLRGTRKPEDGFARLDSSESEHGRTTRWETMETRPGYWRGRVRIAHDPSLEKDGLLARGREIELAVVPMLFGYPRAAVTMKSTSDEAQEFEARWGFPAPRAIATVGAILGAVFGAAMLALHPGTFALFAALGAPIVGAGLGIAYARDGLRRIESRAHAIRVSALERSLALRETEDRAGTGDLEGTVVAGQYRIGARMGSGASGVIYQATRLTDGMPVAIKLLRAATAHDAVASDRLRRESEALGLSWHPNVVEVIDHGHLTDGTSYLVMELLVGETLSSRLKHGRLSPEALAPIAQHVIDALVAIHAAGVMHRDLKPSNIFLTKDETGAEKVKVFDFGIARIEWEEMRITNMGAPLGTPGYMSPEQESGGDIDARSDLYAVGAILYECLVGETPPRSASDMWKTAPRSEDEVRAASGVVPASPRMPSAAPPPIAPESVPKAWKALVERALAKNPDDRFKDARAMLSELRAIVSEGPQSLPDQARGG